MPYDTLEKQINELPAAAITELTHYVEYLTYIYSKKDKTTSVTSQINDFLKNNADAYDQFKDLEKNSLKSIRELTKNDTRFCSSSSCYE